MNTSQTLLKRFQSVQKASRKLPMMPLAKIHRVLLDVAAMIQKEQTLIIGQNLKDLEKLDKNDRLYDRVLLNQERIESIANDIKKICKLPSPVGKILEKKKLQNELLLTKRAVPFGVIGIIYEARPNVTLDVFSLCFKTQNACILKGGSDAFFSNTILVKLIKKVLKKHNLDEHCIELLSTDREEVTAMLQAHDFIDLIIPRGSKKLIDFVRDNATIPVIETGAGVVHTYFDESGKLKMAQNIIFNAKTRRPSVCNSLDTLIIHEKRLGDLAALISPLQQKEVKLYADQKSYNALHKKYPSGLLEKAAEKNFGMEYLSLQMSIKTVKTVEEAVEHINRYGSKHSESIITSHKKNREYFLKNVDAAVVYANTSTAFTDGGQFDMGAEIGISTQKLHARGPMGLDEITTYKWEVIGNGQIRTS